MKLERQRAPRILALIFVAALIASSTLLMTSNRAGDSGSPVKAPLFSFVQITDVHIRDVASAQVVSQAAQDIAELPSAPAFVINTGDIVDHPSDALYDLYSQQIKAFSCPAYSVRVKSQNSHL
jgi:hypothetical protein